MENKKEKKGSSKVKVIAIIVVVLLVVGVGGYFGYSMFLKDKEETSKKTTHTTQQIPVQQIPQAAINANYLDQVVSEKTFELGEFLVNLADEDGKRYLKVKIYLGHDEKKLDEELEAKKPVIRDAVISILRTKKAADITPKNMNNIKLEIIQRINVMFKEGQLNNVYFYDILVQ